MDTSKDYIKMCDCEEIQKGKEEKPDIGDYVYKKGYSEPSIIVDLDEYYNDKTWKVKLDDDFAYEDTRDLIWLPRQDELQEMVISNYDEISKEYNDANDRLVFDFNDFINADYFNGYSMEQFWLAFIMKEKYSKQWNKNKWIKQ